MPFQVSPGINVSEIDLTLVVPNVATSIGAMAGSFQWGPVLERTSITTENDLVRVFGEPNDLTQEYFHTCSNYLAYSNNLLVVRNIGPLAKNAVVGDSDAGTVSNVNNADDYDTDSFTDQLFVAKYPGELGNSLKVQVIDSDGWADATVNTTFKANFDRAPGTSNDVANANGWDGVEANRPVRSDEMHVLVIDEDGLWTGEPGQVLEKFAFVSKASDAKKIDGSSNYIKTVLRNESRYVWLGQVTRLTNGSQGSGRAAGQGKVGTAFLTFNNSTAALSIPGGSLTGGVDDNILTDGLVQAGYALYIEPDVVDVTLVMAGPASLTTANYIVDTITSVRKDCIALISPAKASVVQAASGAQQALLQTEMNTRANSSYAVMDGAWKYQYDRYNDVFRFVPMNGDIAGLCARTDFTNDPWWSPAGLNRGGIKNIVKLSWEPTKANRDIMYQLGINPLITQRGAGGVLW